MQPVVRLNKHMSLRLGIGETGSTFLNISWIVVCLASFDGVLSLTMHVFFCRFVAYTETSLLFYFPVYSTWVDP